VILVFELDTALSQLVLCHLESRPGGAKSNMPKATGPGSFHLFARSKLKER
jgi:hypothetical protein